MKKNTFKKVGAILAGIALAFTMNAQNTPLAPWYSGQEKFKEVNYASGSGKVAPAAIKAAAKADLSVFEYANPNEYVHWIQYGQIKDIKLIDGWFVTFQKNEISNDGKPLDDNKPTNTFRGGYSEIDYLNIESVPLNTSTVFKYTDEDGSTGLGVFQDQKTNTRVEYWVSTKGLSDVKEIGVDMGSYGDPKYINRMYDWNATVYVYELDGKFIASAKYEPQPLFTAKNHKLNTHTYLEVVRTSSAEGKFIPGDLDNKIILIVFESTQSVDDPAYVTGEEGESSGSMNSEPLTIFFDARVISNHPELEFTTESTKIFEAGAGRNTSCEPDTLGVKIDYFNTIYSGKHNLNGTAWKGFPGVVTPTDQKFDRNGDPDNYYTKKFDGKVWHDSDWDRNWIYNVDVVDNGPQEEVAYFEIVVEYPFILDGIQVSKGVNSDEAVKEYMSIDAKIGDSNTYHFARVNAETGEPAIAGVDKAVKYRIPREWLVQSDIVDDHNRISTVNFTYYYAPQEVKKFERANYIWATTSAEASDTAFYSLEATSIPTYNEEGEMFFDKYVEDQAKVPVTFKNLPFFNNGWLNWKIGDYTFDGRGGLLLTNHTHADKMSTDRYDDDVDVIGWKVSYKVGDEVKDTYLYGKVLPMAGFGMPKLDWDNLLDAWCSTCVINPFEYVQGTLTYLEIIDCSGNVHDNIEAIYPLFHYHRGDVNIDDKNSLYVNEEFHIHPALKYTAATNRFDKGTTIKLKNPIDLEGLAQEQIDKYINDIVIDAINDFLENTLKLPADIINDIKIDIPFVSKIETNWAFEVTEDVLNVTVKGDDGKDKVVVTDYVYSAKDLMDSENYKGWIMIYGSNQFVWYSFKDQDLLSHAMGIVSPLFKKADDRDRADLFFAPYDDTSAKVYYSRPHTVYIKATGLIPDADGDGKTATLKVFKEQFTLKEATNDRLYHTNAFLYTAGAKDIDKAYWNTSTGTIDANKVNGEKFGKYKGTSVVDTLYFEIDLDDIALVNRIKNQGLELEVVYVPQNDLNIKAILWDLIQGCGFSVPNVFDHLAQFGISTNDGKGYNEFYTFGTTDNGLVTTMNADYVEGSYNSIYNFILNHYNLFEHYPTIRGIYREMFDKDYQTRYVETCYPEYQSMYVVAGINIMDPVDLLNIVKSDEGYVNTYSNKEGAFKYTIVPLPDLNGEPYATVKDAKDMTQLVPNKYGEILFLVIVDFDPSDRDGIEMSIAEYKDATTETIHQWAQYLAQDTIVMAPVQRSKEIANRVKFYDLNDYNYNIQIDAAEWSFHSIFAPFVIDHYGLVVNDTLSTSIKGDVKVPEVWFSKDYEGLERITELDFQEIAAGGERSIEIFVQGRDLPHYGTSSDLSETKIEQEIYLEAGELLSGFEGTYSVREQSINTATNLDEDGNVVAYDFVRGTPIPELEEGETWTEIELLPGLLRGDVVIPVQLTVTPLIEDLCVTEDILNMSAVCGDEAYAPALAVDYTPILDNPVIIAEAPGTQGGSDYLLKWEPVTGAEYYQAAIGHWTPKYLSDNIFISEVFVADNKLYVELFNGTGHIINRQMGGFQNYWLKLTKSVEGEKDVVEKISLDQFEIQGSKDPFEIFNYEPAFTIIDLDETSTAKRVVTYTVRLMEGLDVAPSENPDYNSQIDIYMFNTASTWLARKWDTPANEDGFNIVMNHGDFNIGLWKTTGGSLPEKASFQWENTQVFDGKLSYAIQPDEEENSIIIHNLAIRTNYTVAVYAYDQCVTDEDGNLRPSVSYRSIPSSNWATEPEGDIYFSDAPEWVEIDLVDGSSVNILGEAGYVNIQGAAGKTVIVSDILGRQVANKYIDSNDVRIAAPAGIVVVSIDGAAVKTVVK